MTPILSVSAIAAAAPRLRQRAPNNQTFRRSFRSRSFLTALRLRSAVDFPPGPAPTRHRYPGALSIDLAHPRRRQRNRGGGEVLLERVQHSCGRDGYDPRVARQQPGQRNLRTRRTLLAAIGLLSSTTGWFAATASGVRRGKRLRTSELSKRESAAPCPVRKPWPSGLHGTKPTLNPRIRAAPRPPDRAPGSNTRSELRSPSARYSPGAASAPPPPTGRDGVPCPRQSAP
jgi:hypothetical protein